MAAVVTADRVGFADGIDVARDLVERTGVRDPARLLDAAAMVESRATTSLELGVACGLRLIAGDITDGTASL